MGTLRKSVLLAIVSAWFTPPPPAAFGEGIELGVKETSLGNALAPGMRGSGPLDPLAPGMRGSEPLKLSVSPDTRRVAFTAPRGTGFVVVVDGKEWDKRYATVSKPVFSPDSKRLACVVSNKDSQRFVIDGEEADKEYPSISNLRFAPDGRLVFVAVDKKARKWWFVIGDWESGKMSGAFVAHRDDTLIFSPDGEHFAFDTADGSLKRSVTLDGKNIHTFLTEFGMKLQFTANGHLVYVCYPMDRNAHSSALLASHGSRGMATYGTAKDGLRIHSDSLKASEDGKRLAAIVHSPDPDKEGREKARVLVWDAATLQVEAAVDVDATYFRWDRCKFAFNPTGKGFGFITLIPDKRNVPDSWERRLVVDGKELTSDGRVWDFAFSPDGKHLAYTGDPGRKPQLFVDGRAVEKTADQVDEQSSIFFSPDGKHAVVTAGIGFGKKRLFVDGDKGPDFDEIAKQSIRFSADGARFAYVARDGGDECVVADGVAGKKYRGEILPRLRFSPDGKHLAYQVRRGTKWTIVVDGVESREEYDSFPSAGDLVFDGPDALHTIAEWDGQYFRVEFSIKPR
jgi:WD40 repeat protein